MPKLSSRDRRASPPMLWLKSPATMGGTSMSNHHPIIRAARQVAPPHRDLRQDKKNLRHRSYPEGRGPSRSVLRANHEVRTCPLLLEYRGKLNSPSGQERRKSATEPSQILHHLFFQTSRQARFTFKNSQSSNMKRGFTGIVPIIRARTNVSGDDRHVSESLLPRTWLGVSPQFQVRASNSIGTASE
jgi:hypothetical protein